MIIKKNKGFTLIELLVVIAIIGILSSIVLVSLGGARQKARNARRESDIRQISLAMEMWYDSNNGSYTSTTAIPSGLAPFLSPLPKDPNGGAYGWINNTAGVGVVGVGQWYCAYATSEALTSGEEGFCITATQKGVRETSTIPLTGAACIW